MPLTYDAIFTTVTGSDSSAINITSIPQTYTDLILSMTTRTNIASSSTMLMRINNSSGSTYSYQRISGASGTVSSIQATNDNSVELGASGNLNLSNANTGILIEFPEYRNTNQNRVWVFTSGGIGDTSSGMRITQGAGMNTTSSAITQINIFNPTYQAGTSITLWGVLKA